MQQEVDKHTKIQSQGFQDSQHPCFLEQYFDLKTESYSTKVNTINQFIHSKTIIFKGLFMRKAVITITIVCTKRNKQNREMQVRSQTKCFPEIAYHQNEVCCLFA